MLELDVRLTRDGRESHLLTTFPTDFMAFHWHGETFSLPHGAIHLVESAGCPRQAFLYGTRAVGLQFHLEMEPTGITALLADLQAAGLQLADLSTSNSSLEEIFVGLVKEDAA